MNLKRRDITPELIQKFIAGNCTAQEEYQIAQFLKDNPEEAETNVIMEESWRQMLSMPTIQNSDESKFRYDSIRTRIGIRGGTSRLIVFKIAASLLFLVAAVYTTYQYSTSIANYFDPISYVHVETLRGQQLTVMLPDGSQIILNAASSITYPDKFRGNTRKVKLEGEAFFSVKRDESKPFIVHSGIMFTKVLGTSFNVNAYSENNDLRVTVATGKVGVGLVDSLFREISPVALLEANQQITYNSVTKMFSSIGAVPSSSVHGWMNGRLHFKDATFEEVAKILERWYDVSIVIDGRGATTCTFTADFRKKMTLRDVLETMSMTHRLTFQLADSKAIVHIDDCVK